MTREEILERAGEYVLGLIEGTEKLAFEAAMQADAELAAAVQRLTAQLQPLDDTAAGTGNPALWPAIAARIATTPQQRSVAAPPPAANENRRAAPMLRWAGLAASLVLSLGVGYLAGVSLQPPPARPTMIAVLLNEGDASPGAIIEAFGDDSVRIVPLELFEVPEGQVLEVWTLPDADTGPVSLGTLGSTEGTRLVGPDLPPPAAGQLYEITLEPAPRSPTGRPTGPILVKGFAKPPV